jgi:hypothetical protein
MAEPNTPPPLTASRSEHIFPTLTSAQIARVAEHGRTRTVRSDEILVEQGDRDIPFLPSFQANWRLFDRQTQSKHFFSLF